ncbi:SDR family NAD(P)-dependent oxidoreductase [Streptomyces armeniacus]|uniref:SDR family NAD(P)-dependent oxidoreductase n=1 Tax=Streptomyces armeniacus TaxID=83291 RepID=A0A345XK06_9ACTN|nr:type I polyketide synthase [Streptomyces armeniacus]AXK31972.1 SDR family NAD(P)-dependent oxidoreductase [Streptomyces armeniacus]
MSPGEADLVRPLPELLREHARHFGDAVAFEDRRTRLTYWELERRTGRLAGRLAELAGGRGERVAILLGNRVEAAESLLAVVRASAVGVPLDPGCPDAELAGFLDDSGARVLVTDRERLARLRPLLAGRPGLTVVAAGEEDTGRGEAADGFLGYEELARTRPHSPAPDDLGLDEVAWLLYSSGSSGAPKGVLSTQRNRLAPVAAGFAGVLGLSRHDRLLWPLPLHHAMSQVAAVLAVAATGASARFLPRFSVADVLGELRRTDAPFTLVGGVPTTYAELLDAVRAQEGGRLGTPALRACLSGGAPAGTEFRQAFEETCGVPFHEHYGSTEAGPVTMPALGDGTAAGSCGPVIPGTRVRVGGGSDGRDAGEGELWVSGPGVMAGYHRRPEATAEVLRDGWFRTGDLARIDASGELVITGRVGELILRGGKNVHPAEVEAVLRELPGVADAAVAGRPHPALGEVPVAYLVPEPATALDRGRILAACRTRLSAFKVPADLYELARVPRTASGKVRRHALEDEPARLLAPEPAGAPAPDALALVRAEAAAVLGCTADEVEPGTALRDLGLDSMTSTVLRERLSAATGLSLSAAVVFDFPTAAALAAHLRQRGVAAPYGSVPVRGGADRDDGDPVVIVGMACRYPGGVDSPERLWRLVADGVDAIGPFPADRGWDTEGLYDPDPGRAGRTYVLEGGFVAGADRFDAAFFGISPREALAMDPQHRLLLEVAWEAVERAGVDPRTLRGSPTGVYAGVMYSDYANRGAIPDHLEGYVGTGNAGSVASGRIAYTLGLEGPALTVDTACSSSLVALHLAAQALRRGECTHALAGGVTVMSGPSSFVEFSRQRALAPDGRCKAFGASADGTGWAEGAGMLLLCRLSEARRAGLPVLAAVPGSAVNQDGASNGLTAPHGPAQRRVIGQALADAGLAPADIDAVEAHGTGTRLGDVIEAEAFLAAYGQGAREHPLWLGSVKSNIGHTQAAAGVAGVIKTVQAMAHGTLPRTLHAEEPNPGVDWSSGTVSLLDKAVEWPRTGRPRRAGVSSFGISGTNAHVILEQAPEEDAPAGSDDGPDDDGAGLPVPFPVSARSAPGLRAQARRLHDRVAADPDARPADIGWSLATTRTAFEHRAVIVARDRRELLGSLRAVAEGRERPEVRTGGPRQNGRLVLLFAGESGQRPGTGQELYGLHAQYPAFRRSFDETCALLDPLLPTPLREVLSAAGDAQEGALLRSARYGQPALFALETALFRLLESWGVRPGLVAGHSAGEVAAAHAAGVLSLADACTLVAARGRLVDELPADGGTADVQDAFAAVAYGLAYAPPRLPLVSALSDRAATDEELYSPDFWVEHVRRPVRFAGTMAYLRERGATHCVEVGPDAVLTEQARDRLASPPPESDAAEPLVVPTLRGACPEPDALLDTVAALHAGGVPVDWRGVFAGRGPRRTALPTYAFQRRRYWLGPGTPPPPSGDSASAHPFLRSATPTADDDGLLLSGLLSLREQPWLAGHAVAGGVLLPATAFVDMALHAGGLAGTPVLAELTLTAPLPLAADGAVDVQLKVAGADGDGRRAVVCHARPHGAAGGRPWRLHATGTLAPPAPPGEKRAADGSWPPAGAVPLAVDGAGAPLDGAGLYERLARAGLEYGPAFRGLHAVWRLGDDLYAEVALPETTGREAPGFALHPALLDAALHTVALAGLTAQEAEAPEEGGGAVSLPFAFSGVRLHAAGARRLRVRVSAGADGRAGLELTDPAGAPVATVRTLALRPFRGAAPEAGVARGDCLFRTDWVHLPAPSASARAEADERAEVPEWGVLGGAGVRLRELLAPPGSGVPVYADVAAAGADAPSVVLAPCPPPGAADAGAEADAAAEAHRTAAWALALVQDWLAEPRLARSRLAVVTSGAAGPDSGETDIGSVPVWGLVRSALRENPGRFTLVDTDGHEDSVRALPALLAGAPEAETAVRRGEAYVPRLVPASGARSGGGSRGMAPEGTVLVTGGTGSLGMLIARHLVTAYGVRHLLLAGRRGSAAPGVAELCEELAESGARVTVEACDIADRTALAALLDGIPAAHPLTGVVHSAGVLDDGIVPELTPVRLDRVLRPKADAALALHELTKGRDLAMFALFSSVAGTFGSAGQANYAAANCVLDALARHRRQHGLAGTSVVWGPWRQSGGMTEHLKGTDVRRMTRSGFEPLGTDEGLALFDAAVGSDDAVLVAARLGAAAGQGAAAPYDGRSRAPERAPVAEAGGRGALSGRLAAAPPGEHGALLLAEVRTVAAEVLGHPEGESAIGADDVLADLGMDSLAAVELRNGLETATDLPLPSTLVFDFPTPRAVAAHLAERYAHEPAPEAAPAQSGAAEEQGAPDSLSALFRTACAQGKTWDGMALLTVASRFRTVFDLDEAPGAAPEAVTLASGGAGHRLICFPALSALSGPQEYTRLAHGLRGLRPVSALRHPGFRRGEALPATLGAFVSAQAAAVRTGAGGEPFVLLGRSAGGWAAQAVAERLAAEGSPPAAVVLVDTYPGESGGTEETLSPMTADMLHRAAESEPAEPDRLTAMAGYFGLFAGWEPVRAAAPTLVVRARDPLPGADPAPAWDLPHTEVTVPGDHFTVLETHSRTTALAVQDWLTALP